MTDPRYDVELRRYGALDILEHEAGLRAVPREDVEGALELHLDTLGPGDTLVLTVHRRMP